MKNSEPKIGRCFFMSVDLENAFDWIPRQKLVLL